MDTTIDRLIDYVGGRIDKIEELMEERLRLDMTPKGLGNGFWKYNIATPAVLRH